MRVKAISPASAKRIARVPSFDGELVDRVSVGGGVVPGVPVSASTPPVGCSLGEADGGVLGGVDGGVDGGVLGGSDGGVLGGVDGGVLGGSDGGVLGGVDAVAPTL